MTRRNRLLDPPPSLPCEVGVSLTAGEGGWKENCFTCPNLLFLYKK